MFAVLYKGEYNNKTAILVNRIYINQLIYTKYTIAEITDMVGFSDAKYFREVFKKYYGVSPSKYGESEKTGSYPAINLKNEK